MKITDIRFGMLRVPLKTPFKTALRTVEQVEDIVVMVHTDSGHIGYGELQVLAEAVGAGTDAARAPIVDRRDGHAEIFRQFSDIEQWR